MGSITSPFTLKDEPVENQRRLRVIMIGAGFCGIYTTIRISQRLKNIDLTVYEKNPETSGVWYMNRYPGLACDIPSYSYQFSFAPNPYWSSLYAPGPEIRAYMQSVAEQYGATRFIKTSHNVQHCSWDEVGKVWNLVVENLKTGEVIKDTADILLSARGGLNQIQWPDIHGLWDFKGKVLHSGQWEEGLDLRNKRVGVIGNGSSAIQIVPAIQPVEGIQLWNFARSRTWISSSFGDSAMVKLGKDPSQTHFTRDHMEHLARNPKVYETYRRVIETEASRMYGITLKDSAETEMATLTFAEQMKKRLEGRNDLFEALIPEFSPGCRRLTPGPGYLEAFSKNNVNFCNTPIEKITKQGIKLQTGELIELDIVVCATGYDASTARQFTATGRNGTTIEEKFKPYPQSYLSVAVDEFPNFLIIGGHNSGLGSGSLVSVFEALGDYVVKVIRKIQRDDYATFEVKKERVTDFNQYINEYFKRTVYTGPCSSWYRSPVDKSRVVALWPGSSAHCLEVLRSPRWEDYNWETRDSTGNLLRFLGNGWSSVLMDGDPSFFLDEDSVEVPEEGRPEEGEKYRRRAFCY